jgi:hypothetical protein
MARYLDVHCALKDIVHHDRIDRRGNEPTLPSNFTNREVLNGYV